MPIPVDAEYRYEQIAADVERKLRIGEFPAGSRLPTDAKQAAAYGVNPLTVRKAMLLLQERGLITRRRGRGTFAAERVSRPLSIGYIGPLEEHFYSDLFLSVQQACRAASGRLHSFAVQRLEHHGELWAELQPSLCDVDAVVVVLCEATESILPQLVKAHPRTVLLSLTGNDQGIQAPLIRFDAGGGVELAALHLIRRGHQRLGLLTRAAPEQALTDGDWLPPDPRWNAGFRHFHGLEIRRDFELVLSTVGMFLDDEERNLQSMIRFLDRPDRPTGVVCDFDFRAPLVYAAAARLGLQVPDDLSVAGVGDTPYSRSLTPRLTTVNLGQQAAGKLALHLCTSDLFDTHLHARLEPKLVRNSSCQDHPPVPPSDIGF